MSEISVKIPFRLAIPPIPWAVEILDSRGLGMDAPKISCAELDDATLELLADAWKAAFIAAAKAEREKQKPKTLVTAEPIEDPAKAGVGAATKEHPEPQEDREMPYDELPAPQRRRK